MRAVSEVFRHREVIQMALINARASRFSQTPHQEERLPLRCDGDDFGRVEARIPVDEFFHFAQQRNFGMDGFCDNGGMNDFLKTRPAYRVKTVSGRTVCGYTGSPRTASPGRRGVTFGRGTMEFAK